MLNINVHRTFAREGRIVDINCSAEVKKGQITALFGRSGVGKTTVLRIIAGLEKITTGAIVVDGVNWDNRFKTDQRSVSLVFQQNNLFEHMSVQGNLSFALQDEQYKKAMKMVEIFQMTNRLRQKVSSLSGGEKQKIALIRGLCLNREVILLDEPFSALDDESIVKAMDLVSSELKNKYVILVTHRKDFVLHYAKHLILMDDGFCRQGKPEDMIQLPFK